MPSWAQALLIAGSLLAPALWFGRPCRRPQVPAVGPRSVVEGLDRRSHSWEVIDTAWTPEDVHTVMVDAMAVRRHVLLRVVDRQVAA